MKRIFIFLLFSLFFEISYGQNANEILNKRSVKTDSLRLELQKYNIQDDKVEYLQNARKVLKSTVDDVLKLEDFNNKTLQKVLMKPLTEYYDAFTFESNKKIINTLRYGFENKEDFINHYKASEALLLGKLIDRQYQALIDDSQRVIDEVNMYISKNLKRLGITIEEYEKLSENDKELLEKSFK
ncbi:hypothetical protein BN1195_01145 [Chryseobacterium oranimense G311]|uniref:hypothetical protein n=1 Tax=Chryseobacterium oranimense TaxID=421058 RepID=UPI000533ACB0|nr:hypothetical protein [Chryseobacterium oranimense]CEJ68854.1 hypothetical protein BN1195_01145 [Chryseobacterium oranimense G311]